MEMSQKNLILIEKYVGKVKHLGLEREGLKFCIYFVCVFFMGEGE